MANLYDKAQYIFVAGANKSGSVYGLSPIAGTTNVTLVSASTFRASTGSRTNGSGILENVNSHILRVDYSGTASCPSYKFEPQRTNYLLNSLYLSGSGTATNPNFWRTLNSTWSLASDATSPIGTGLTGMLREGTAAGGNYYIRNSLSGSNYNSTGSFTFSVYAKRSGSGTDSNSRNLMINAGAVSTSTGGTYFILEGTGSVISTTTTFVSGAFIEQLPNGWYRCSTLLNFLANTPQPAFYITSGSAGVNSEAYTGNGTASLYLCAAQAESGSNHGFQSSPAIANGTFITSYISTSFDAPGTRTDDNTITLPSSSNSGAWTYFMTWKRNYVSNVFVDVAITSGSGTTRFAGIYNNGVAIWNSGSVTLTSGSSLPIGQEYKFAIRYNSGILTWFLNGSKRFSITWPTTGTWGNPIISGDTSNSTVLAQGSFYIRSAALFNQSLTDLECQSLTATGSGTL